MYENEEVKALKAALAKALPELNDGAQLAELIAKLIDAKIAEALE